MVYLRSFTLPSLTAREQFMNDVKMRCYNTVYPFDVFALREVPTLHFAPITILCGGNGSGKSTMLNVLAAHLGIAHGAAYNRSSFFDAYVERCSCELTGAPAAVAEGRIITSDDVFDYMLNVRSLNDGVDVRRTELMDEYVQTKKRGYTFRTMEDYDDLKRYLDAKRSTKSAYVREHMMANVPERSNGESALGFFTQAIRENALYLLDEPENSLSAIRQQELAQFLADSARFYGCQFVIATHSPFLLATPGAQVYDMEADPIAVRPWTELRCVRTYYDFFRAHQKEFGNSY